MLDLCTHGPLDTYVLDADDIITGYRLFREDFYALLVRLERRHAGELGSFVKLLLPDGSVVESFSAISHEKLGIVKTISSIDDTQD